MLNISILNAADYGVPQKRERVFILGFRDIEDFFKHQFPTPSLDKVGLKLVIDEAENHNEKWFFSEKAVEGMLRVKAKMNKGREQDLDKPCNTISSHLAKVSLNSTDPVIKINGRFRRFTPREAASIQSFPLSFKLDSVSENRQYRAIGNAVPPVLMWYVTKTLMDLL
jgi:DNA (cytosine-5)-methyltransferase 1